MKTLSSTLLPSLTSSQPHTGADLAFPLSSSPVDETLAKSYSGTPVPFLPHSQSLDGLSALNNSITRALTPGGRPASVGPPSLPPVMTTHLPSQAPASASSSASSNPFRRSTALTSPFARSTSAASLNFNPSVSHLPTNQVAGAQYTSSPLNGIAGGRLLKSLGDMYLLAGMYGAAIKCFEDGAERCRGVGDMLWEAVAREGWAVAGIGQAWGLRDGSVSFLTFVVRGVVIVNISRTCQNPFQYHQSLSKSSHIICPLFPAYLEPPYHTHRQSYRHHHKPPLVLSPLLHLHQQTLRL